MHTIDHTDLPVGLGMPSSYKRRQMRRMVVAARRFYRFVTLRDVAVAFGPAAEAIEAVAR